MKRFLLAVTVVMLGLFTLHIAAADAAINPCQDGTTVLPTGTQVNPYENFAPPEDRSFDGYNSRFTPNAPSNDHGVEIGGEAPLRLRLCLGGPVVDGNIPNSYTSTWTQWHDNIGGFGVRMYAKDIEMADMTIDNVEDGIKLQNCPEHGSPPNGGDTFCQAQQPGGKANITDVHIFNHHDDGIDDDDCIPFNLNDSLLEGHTGISVQEESSSTGACVSSGEDNTINITNTIIRTMPVSAFDPANDDFAGGGKWFKFQGSHPHHTLVLSGVTLVVDQIPRSGWPSLDLPGFNGTPGDVQWLGSNNQILYLNRQGQTYHGPFPGSQGIPNSGPNAVAFKTGQDARDEFVAKRKAWYERHGCTDPGATDLNPKDDPVQHCVAPK